VIALNEPELLELAQNLRDFLKKRLLEDDIAIYVGQTITSKPHQKTKWINFFALFPGPSKSTFPNTPLPGFGDFCFQNAKVFEFKDLGSNSNNSSVPDDLLAGLANLSLEKGYTLDVVVVVKGLPKGTNQTSIPCSRQTLIDSRCGR
jgi:hypothetical protein